MPDVDDDVEEEEEAEEDEEEATPGPGVGEVDSSMGSPFGYTMFEGEDVSGGEVVDELAVEVASSCILAIFLLSPSLCHQSKTLHFLFFVLYFFSSFENELFKPPETHAYGTFTFTHSAFGTAHLDDDGHTLVHFGSRRCSSYRRLRRLGLELENGSGNLEKNKHFATLLTQPTLALNSSQLSPTQQDPSALDNTWR